MSTAFHMLAEALDENIELRRRLTTAEADALEEAAAEMRAAVDFQNLSADQQSGVVLAVGELHRRAAALRSNEKGSTNDR